jgi:hypothetical protein
MKRTFFIVLSAIVLVGGLYVAFRDREPVEVPQSVVVPSVSASSVEKRWAWRKDFSAIELTQLAMSWNGERIVMAGQVSDGAGPTRPFLLGVDHNSGITHELPIESAVERLFLTGSGRELLVDLENGQSLFFRQFDQDLPQREVFSRSGRSIALHFSGDRFVLEKEAGTDQAQISQVTIQDRREFVFPETGPVIEADSSMAASADTAWLVLFPFLAEQQLMVRTSGDGRVFANSGKKRLWEHSIPGRPLAVSATFLEGDIIAVAGRHDGGIEIHQFSASGEVEGSFRHPDSALIDFQYSKTGSFYVIYTGDKDHQRITVYDPSGEARWQYGIDRGVNSNSQVVEALAGTTVIADFQVDDTRRSIMAWKVDGTPLWVIPIDQPIVDWKVSWNGKRIAILTQDSQLLFYNLDRK